MLLPGTTGLEQLQHAWRTAARLSTPFGGSGRGGLGLVQSWHCNRDPVAIRPGRVDGQ